MGEHSWDYSTVFPISSVHMLNQVNELARDGQWRSGAVRYLLTKDGLSKNRRKKPALRIAHLIYGSGVLGECTWTGRAHLSTRRPGLQLMIFINKLYMEVTKKLQPGFDSNEMADVLSSLCMEANRKMRSLRGNANVHQHAHPK